MVKPGSNGSFIFNQNLPISVLKYDNYKPNYYVKTKTWYKTSCTVVLHNFPSLHTHNEAQLKWCCKGWFWLLCGSFTGLNMSTVRTKQKQEFSLIIHVVFKLHIWNCNILKVVIFSFHI